MNNNITDLQSYTLKDNTVDKILDCIKNNNFEDISFRTMTEKGFQTGNIINYFSKVTRQYIHCRSSGIPHLLLHRWIKHSVYF